MSFDKRPTKKSKWKGRVVLCVVLIIAGGTLMYFRENLSDRITKVFASTEKDPIPVTTLTRQPFSLTVSADGEIIGLESVLVDTPSTSAGRLSIAWLAEEGSFVEAGDLIVRFESMDARLQLEQRQNSLASNMEDIKITNENQVTDEKNRKIDVNIAEEEYNYAIKTMAQDETIYSRWEIITAASDERFQRQNLDVLKNRVRTQQRADRSRQQTQTIQRNELQTQVGRYEDTLNALELRAPVGGMVLYYRDRRQTEPAVGDNASAGQTIIEIINLDALQARINVLERDGGYLEKDLPVNIRLDAVPDKVFHGVIRTVASVAQSITRNSPLRYFTCDITIVDAGADLKLIRPGMFLRGDIILHEYESCFIVPSGAVTARELQNDTVVFIKNGDRFETRVVETGLSSHGEAVILSGVEEGEMVALVNPEGTRKLSLPDFNLSTTTTQPKGKVMMGPGGGGGGFPGGGGGGFPGGGGGFPGGGGRGR